MHVLFRHWSRLIVDFVTRFDNEPIVNLQFFLNMYGQHCRMCSLDTALDQLYPSINLALKTGSDITVKKGVLTVTLSHRIVDVPCIACMCHLLNRLSIPVQFKMMHIPQPVEAYSLKYTENGHWFDCIIPPLFPSVPAHLLFDIHFLEFAAGHRMYPFDEEGDVNPTVEIYLKKDEEWRLYCPCHCSDPGSYQCETQLISSIRKWIKIVTIHIETELAIAPIPGLLYTGFKHMVETENDNNPDMYPHSSLHTFSPHTNPVLALCRLLRHPLVRENYAVGVCSRCRSFAVAIECFTENIETTWQSISFSHLGAVQEVIHNLPFFCRFFIWHELCKHE